LSPGVLRRHSEVREKEVGTQIHDPERASFGSLFRRTVPEHRPRTPICIPRFHFCGKPQLPSIRRIRRFSP